MLGRYAVAMPLLTLALASGHSGVVHVRTGPEPSDIALFVVAALGVWWLRRRLRARSRRD